MKPSTVTDVSGKPIQKTALATLIGLIAWAGLTQMDEAVTASGQVVAADRLQVVQSPDGGIIALLDVQEGQTVRRGQRVAVLEKDRADAATHDLTSQWAALYLARRRAQAEADGTQPQADATARQYPELWTAQLALYADHQRSIARDIAAFNQAIELAEQEQRIMERLQASGDISPTEVMRSERGLIELRQRREGIHGNMQTEARREVAKIASEMVSLEQRIRERRDVLRRTDLVSPVNGTVHTIRLKTPGGVLRAGEELMQIAPDVHPTTLELRVNPSDIGRLHTGLPASVKLDAWDSTTYGTLKGTVRDISPDIITEQGYPQAQVYYRVLMEVANNPDNSKLDIQLLKSGMRASADILTGQRSILWYLTSPVTRAFSGAMMER